MLLLRMTRWVCVIIAILAAIAVSQTRQAVFSELFEGTTSNWTLSGGGWAFGTPTYSSGPTSAYQGTGCAGTVLNGPYVNSANYTLYSNLIALPNSDDILFSFYEWYALESCCDYINIVVSIDSGRTWMALTSARNGQFTNWTRRSFSLAAYKNKNVRVGFTLTSDGSSSYAGYYIDSLAITTFADLTKKITLNPVPSPTFNRRPVLSWRHNDSVSVYKITADVTPAFSSPIFQLPLSDTFYQSPVNFPFDTIFWKVENASDNRYWSDVSSFSVVDSLQSVIAINPSSFKITQGDTGSVPLAICNATGRKALTYNFKGTKGDTSRILIWSYVTSPSSGSYMGLKSAILMYNPKTVFTDFAYTDSAMLRASLIGKDVFILPRADYYTPSSTYGTLFRNVLSDFTKNGGTILCLYPYSYTAFLTSANLVNLTYTSTASSGYTISIKTPADPLFANVSSLLTRSYLTYFSVATADTAAVLASYSGYGVIYKKSIDIGNLILLGHDFYLYDSSWARVIANATQPTQNAIPSWLTFSSDSGQVAIGQCANVRLRVNASGLASGTYARTISLWHNSQLSANPLFIPCTLIVPQPTLTYALSSRKATLNTGDSVSQTLTLNNTGLSQLSYNVRSAAQSAIVINEVVYNSVSFDEMVELRNRGADQNMTGWRMAWRDNGGYSGSYTFPSGFIFKSGKILSLMSYYTTGTNSDTVLYTTYYMYWYTGTQLSVTLFDNNNKAVDFIYTSLMSDTIPSTTTWKGQGIVCTNCEGLARNKDGDNDTASDWTALATTASQSLYLPNPGQSAVAGPVAGSWLFVNNGTGTLAKSGTVNVGVKFNAAAMLYSGQFVDSLLITHNASNYASPIVVRCTLTVISNIPALVPLTPTPTSEVRPTLQWHPVAGAASYSIQIATTSNFASPLLIQTMVDTFYKPNFNLPLGWIYWKVKSDLNANYSLANAFFVQSDSIPMLNPVVPDSVTNRRPVLTWKKAAGATVYQIQIDTAGTFVSPWLSAPVSDTFLVPMVNLPLGRICWRVSNMNYRSDVYSAVDTFWVKLVTPLVEDTLALPTEFDMADAAPNPFNPSTLIRFAVPSRGTKALRNVSIALYDTKGTIIRTLVDRPFAAGRYQVQFDGKDGKGKGLSSGMYICRMVSDGFVRTTKLILMK